MNTGDSIVALHYSFTSTVGALTATPSASSAGECAYSSQLTQVFVSSSPLQQTATLSGLLCASFLSAHPKMFSVYLAGSPASHLLPIDVYIGDQLMTDISLHSDKVPYCHFSSSVSMSVGSFGV